MFLIFAKISNEIKKEERSENEEKAALECLPEPPKIPLCTKGCKVFEV
jgi:hypothetical protein